MAELHWHAATSAGSADGTALIGQGSVHLAADLPAGALQNAVATLPWPMDNDERLFMNGYQTWTECPELGKRDRQRGTDHIPTAARGDRATASPTAISVRAIITAWWQA